MGRLRNENPHLGLTGVINADMWAKMDDKKRREWVVKHANQILPKLVHMDSMKEAHAELAKMYDVTARYTLLDYHFNQRGEVLYELEWSRAGRSRLININN